VTNISNGFIEKWISKLNDADREMSRIAAEKLGSTKDPAVIPVLVQAVKNRPDEIRVAAVRALGNIRHRSAIPALLPLLRDSNSMVATAAADALGEIGHMSAVSGLIDVCRTYKMNPNRHDQLHGMNRGLYLAALNALRQIDTIQARAAIEKFGR